MKKTFKINILAFFVGISFLFWAPTLFAGDEPAAPRQAAPEASTEMSDIGQMQPLPDQATFKGIILPKRNWLWMTTGHILKEDNGRELAMIEQDKAEQVRQMVGKKVEVVGTLEEEEGKIMIRIIDLKAVDAPSESD